MRKALPIIVSVVTALLFSAEIAEAASLLVSVAGGAIGFLIGGPLGAAVGFAAGGLLGSILFPTQLPTIYGPRLQDKTVQSSAFGSHITWHWGTDRIPAQVIFSSELKETVHETEVGGGSGLGGSQSSITYTYAVDIMLAFGRRGVGILRLWADTKLIYDVTGEPTLAQQWVQDGTSFTVRDGNEKQLPSALEESYHGVGTVSAHRSLFCLEATDFQLADFANRIPNFTAEIYTEGTSAFERIGSYTLPPVPYSYWRSSQAYIAPNGEMYTLAHPFSTPYWYPGYTYVYHWTLSRPNDPVREPHSLWTGIYTQSWSVAQSLKIHSDRPDAAAYGTGGVVTVFHLDTGTQTNCTGATSQAGAWMIVGKDGDYFLFTGHQFYLGGNGGKLIKYVGGAEATSRADIYALTGGALVIDAVASDNYLWVMTHISVLKFNLSDLAFQGQYDISNIQNALAMYAVSDTEHRFVNGSFASNTSFWVSLNEGQPTLDRTTANKYYTSTAGFWQWGLHYQNGIYVVDFTGSWGGFPPLVDFFGPSGQSFGIPLWKIVRDINLMAGIDSVVTGSPPAVGRIAVGELLDLVHGYSLTRAMSARDALQQLVLTYHFNARMKDLIIDYPKRGKAPVALIPSDDLAARTSLNDALPARLEQTRRKESELPLRVHIIYNNYEFSYQPGHEYAPREITETTKTVNIEIAVAITATKAREVADIILATDWLERHSYKFVSSRKYLPIDAADNVTVEITEVSTNG